MLFVDGVSFDTLPKSLIGRLPGRVKLRSTGKEYDFLGYTHAGGLRICIQDPLTGEQKAASCLDVSIPPELFGVIDKKKPLAHRIPN